LSSPRLYGQPVEEGIDSISTPEESNLEPASNDLLKAGAIERTETEPESATQGEPSPNEKPVEIKVAQTGADDSKGALSTGSQTGSKDSDAVDLYYGGIPTADSASAVDDDIWRRFDLAEEYHAMGVIANREASWEEAQYYFERCLKILANLDIETDSVLTPEAVKYNTILDNVVADYHVALRSLGNLRGNTAPSVLIERFGELEDRLGHDTLLVYNGESSPISYDLPVVMNDRVKSSVIYFQTVAKEAFTKYLSRSKKYERLFKEILDQYGLPNDLIYLSLVESGYNPHAYSWARAMGLWQFISSTGRLYGLKRNWWIDERKDPIKATHAAARFLKDLYKQFGHWELAMAGYNGGPRRVSRAIEKQKTIDFWKLRLKRQTMDYVPLIYAAAIIAKDPGRYGFSYVEHEPEVVWEEVQIDRCLDLKAVAREIGCTFQEIKEINPELLRNYTPPNDKKYTLKIPVGKKKKFLAAYDGMPSPKETSWVRHKIRRGETVSTIAARYGVSQYAIFEANNLKRRSRIYAGKTIIVPVPLDRDYTGYKKNSKDYRAKGSVYAVRSGDTLWDIARAFGTSVDALRRINYIERGSRIYVGQKMKIPSNATRLKERSESPKRYASRKSGGSSKSTSATASSGSKGTHKVRAGDTLWDIARKYGTTTARIRQQNGMGRSSRIYPGQILNVPTVGSLGYVIHKVRRGETLGQIARKYRTTITRILAQNHLTDPDVIKVGDKLRIDDK